MTTQVIGWNVDGYRALEDRVRTTAQQIRRRRLFAAWVVYAALWIGLALNAWFKAPQ